MMRQALVSRLYGGPEGLCEKSCCRRAPSFSFSLLYTVYYTQRSLRGVRRGPRCA